MTVKTIIKHNWEDTPVGDEYYEKIVAIALTEDKAKEYIQNLPMPNDFEEFKWFEGTSMHIPYVDMHGERVFYLMDTEENRPADTVIWYTIGEMGIIE